MPFSLLKAGPAQCVIYNPSTTTPETRRMAIQRSFKRPAVGAARLLPLLLAVAAAIAFVAVGGRHYVTLSVLAANARWLRETAEGWGILAPILFVAANALMLMVLVIPAWFCTIGGGLLFGRWLGTAYALVGTTLGASGVFLSARAGLSDLAERAGSQAGGIAAGFRTNAFIYLVQLRLVPLFPFTLVNIAAALGGLSLRIYVLATLVGILPSVFIYASLGDLLLDPALQDRLPDTNLLLQPRFLIPLLGLAALALLPLFVGRVRRRWAADPGADGSAGGIMHSESRDRPRSDGGPTTRTSRRRNFGFRSPWW